MAVDRSEKYSEIDTNELNSIKDALAAYKKNRRDARIYLYRPFGPEDRHFQGDPHTCDYNHVVSTEELYRDLGKAKGVERAEPDTQADFHASYSRKRAIFAGNRGGKTLPGAVEAFLFMMGEDGGDYGIWENMPEEAIKKYRSISTPNRGWIVSRSYDTQLEGAQYWLLDKNLIPSKFIDSTKMKHGDKYESITLINGSRVTFKSSESDPEVFQSAEKRWIWFDEEPRTEKIFDECLMRQSGSFPLDWWLTMTPLKGMTFVHNRIFEDKDKDKFVWTLWDNPYFPNEKVWDMENDLDDEEAKKRIYGMFIGQSSKMYPMFNEARHVKESFKIPSEWDIIEAIDLGFQNPSAVVWLAIAPSNVWYVVDELYEKGLTPSELSRRIHEKRDNAKWSETGRWEPRYSIIDPQANETNRQTKQSDRDRLAMSGDEYGPAVYTKPANKSNRGHNEIRNRLRPGEKGPRLLVLEHCENTVHEFNNYETKQWSTSSARDNRGESEQAKKKDDHIMNGIRYLANESLQYVGPSKAAYQRDDYKTRTNSNQPITEKMVR